MQEITKEGKMLSDTLVERGFSPAAEFFICKDILHIPEASQEVLDYLREHPTAKFEELLELSLTISSRYKPEEEPEEPEMPEYRMSPEQDTLAKNAARRLSGKEPEERKEPEKKMTQEEFERLRREPRYLMKAKNGMMIWVPASRLKAWTAAQEAEDYELTEQERRVADSIVRKIYGKKEE